jgi:ABC-type transport system involved in cytochrome c biogenesis permease subunit
MILKPDIQGLLIYLTMAGYLMVFVMAIKFPKSAKALFLASFLLGTAGLIYRWVDVQHLPMQNMFEVFLFLGFCIWPIHILSRRILDASVSYLMMIDAGIGFVVLFPAGFIFNHHPQFLPPALQYWLFGPHVAAYMAAYIFAAKAAVFAAGGLILSLSKRDFNRKFAGSGYRLIALSFPLLTLGLFLGSIWGRYAWGDWWGWDPKELWSLVCWLVYLIYFHARYAWPKRYTLQHILSIAGLICIIITLLWVNLSKLFPGLHNYAA